jgi:hypothetical protein
MIFSSGIPMLVPERYETRVAEQVAEFRVTENNGERKWPDDNMTPAQRMPHEIRAVLAEMMTARFLGLYWTGIDRGRSKTPVLDVGGFIEVRSVSETQHGLVARARDEENAPSVSVWVREPDYLCALRGWHFAAYVKQYGRPFDLDTATPCWILSPDKLMPMSELVDMVATRFSRRADKLIASCREVEGRLQHANR